MSDRVEGRIRRIKVLSEDPHVVLSVGQDNLSLRIKNEKSGQFDFIPIRITDIVIDRFTAENFHSKRYDVFVEVIGKEAEGDFPWKSYENAAVTIEYFVERIII